MIRSRFSSTKNRSNSYANLVLMMQRYAGRLVENRRSDSLKMKIKWLLLLIRENIVINPPSLGQLSSLWAILDNMESMVRDGGINLKTVKEEFQGQMNVSLHDIYEKRSTNLSCRLTELMGPRIIKASSHCLFSWYPQQLNVQRKKTNLFAIGCRVQDQGI